MKTIMPTSDLFIIQRLRDILGLYAAYVTEFEQNPWHKIAHIVLMFKNGYGASIIPSGMSGRMWEIGVLDSNGDLCYTTPITNDVMAWRSTEELHKILADIYRLPKAK